ncbi:MAG: YbjN domain-containing protein [Bauldia sp.]
MISLFRTAAALAAGVLAAAPALAQTETATVYRGMTGAEIAALVVEAGFSAERDIAEEDKSPMVITEMSGLNVYIYTYVCDREEAAKGPPARCESVQFLLPLSDVIDLETIDAWNREYRYAKAWSITDDGGVRLTFDFLVDGVTGDHFIRSINLFADLIEEFIDFL